MSASRQQETWSELAVRENDGLAVSLLWSNASGRTRIVVVDQMLEAELHIDVPPACALDSFYHPFAYAAGRGLQSSRADSKAPTPSLSERSAA